MARIPIGMEYQSTVEGMVPAPFECKHCKHTATASVKSKGEGEASAVAFIGMDGAKSRAAEEAAADMVKNATALARMAPCPKCGGVDEEAISAERSSAFGKSALLCGGFIVFMLVFPTRSSGNSLPWLVPIVGVVAAYVTYRKSAWRWEEARERVTFDVNASPRRVPKQDPADALRPGFIWGDALDDAGVTWPFVKDLSLGLLRDAEDGLSWPAASELGELTPEAAQQRALRNLSVASDGGLTEVAPGVWRAHWDDELAASRLLVPAVAARVAVKGKPVAFTASEDTLFIAGSDDGPALLRAFELSREDLQRVLDDDTSVAGRFTAHPWLWRDAAWTPWQLPEGHALKNKVAELDAELGDKGWRPASRSL